MTPGKQTPAAEPGRSDDSLAKTLAEADFGGVGEQMLAARAAAAVALDNRRGVLLIEGDDRSDFLNRVLTNQLEGLEPGLGRHALLLDNKGHVRADLDLWAERDRLIVVTAAEAVAPTVETLRRYVLRSDVRLHAATNSLVVLRLIGPATDDVMKAVGAPVPAPGATMTHATAQHAGTRWLRSPRRPGVEAIVASAEAVALWDALRAAGTRPVGAGVVQTLRVETGLPAHGRELTGDEFPQELGLDAAIDYEKGCYLGQETVARIHYRGQVNRVLVGLRMERDVAAGTPLFAQKSSVGTITSAAHSDRLGSIGLGYVKRDHAATGTSLWAVPDATENPIVATVSELPFP